MAFSAPLLSRAARREARQSWSPLDRNRRLVIVARAFPFVVDRRAAKLEMRPRG